MCDLTLIDFEDTAMHYATTLRAWRDNMLANADIIRQLGYPDTLINTWRFYFAYCDAGFSERALGAAQMVFVKSAGV
jgi:cyclopropane-fatty-acyl-phospholipid synthase